MTVPLCPPAHKVPSSNQLSLSPSVGVVPSSPLSLPSSPKAPHSSNTKNNNLDDRECHQIDLDEWAGDEIDQSGSPQLYASVQDVPADILVLQQPPPSPTHSNSGSGASETDRHDDRQSHRPGEERVGVDYDVLERHHARNCRHHSPSPTFLNTISMQKSKKQCTNTDEELSLEEDNNEVVSTAPGLSGQGHHAKYSKNPKGSQPAKSSTAGFFPPLWNKLFDLTKAQM
ncbi:hypothetical protein BKA83DRAFT_4486252 [Pisolithus microcarpus]|nr:hypothetical protein BKA83DRAFT_4486252 [Pisolithus microcarpus]